MIPTSMRGGSLPEALERIQSWLERNAPVVASSLQPGLTREELKQILGLKAIHFGFQKKLCNCMHGAMARTGRFPFSMC